MEAFDLVIVGGGAAAWSAAMYARRYGLETAVLQEQFGGETATAGVIENYPGLERVDGFELVNQMRDVALKLGAKVFEGKATEAEDRLHCFRVQAEGRTFLGKALILATGLEHRKMGVPKEDGLRGRGVHYCATCDGPFYKGKRVAVVGGGDSAVKWANQLLDAGVAHVSLIVREKNLGRAEPINRQRLERRSGVTTLFSNEVTALIGAKKLEAVELKAAVAGAHRLTFDAVFVAIGAVPRNDLAQQLDVRLDREGFVIVDPRTMTTRIPGVFAAGDVTDASGDFKQVVTGAAQGAIAATSAYHHVAEHPNVCIIHNVTTKRVLPRRAVSAKKR